MSAPDALRWVFVRGLTLLALAAVLVAPVAAQSPNPEPPAGLTMTAEPMLGGNYRAGGWMAVKVGLRNDGPRIAGELRLLSTIGTISTFSLPVDLPTGANQEHVIYGQVASAFGRYRVELIDEAVPTAIQRIDLSVEASSTRGPRAYVVAERPERLVGGLNEALGIAGRDESTVVTLSSSGLPPKAQPWASMDVLVWQDADSQALESGHVEALRTWLVGGGHLVILGGSTGVTTLGGFPEDLLPYRPEQLIDVPATDLASFGEIPVTATQLSAVTGTAGSGTVIATSGDDAIAAQTRIGLGIVTIVGFDPATPWIAESPLGAAIWSRILSGGSTQLAARVGSTVDDAFIVSALGDIAAVRLPELFHLFALLVAYVFVLGPVNYAILRRRDRRELAWVTIPITIAAFAVIAYVFGVALRGPNVVVNELAIVRGAAGADRGSGQVYVGIFSPGRATYEVEVGNDALVTSSSYAPDPFTERPSQALDVEQGNPSTVRGFGVGFGSIRSFVAEVSLPTPRIDSDLTISGEALTGTITNSSGRPLSGVAMLFGRSVQRIGDLAPTETRSIELEGGDGDFFAAMADQVVGPDSAGDIQSSRIYNARRALVTHLGGGWGRGGLQPSSPLTGAGPVILAFDSTGPLEVSVNGSQERVGETLFVLQAPAAITGPLSLAGSLLQRTVVESDAAEGFEDGEQIYIGHGTMTVEYRPPGLTGRFAPTGLTVRFWSSSPDTTGEVLLPLPPDEQPDPDAPLAVNPDPDELLGGLPRLQLFDIDAQTWVEFQAIEVRDTYVIEDPGRWIDDTGTLRVRFVVRGTLDDFFSFEPRISGTVE